MLKNLHSTTKTCWLTLSLHVYDLVLHLHMQSSTVSLLSTLCETLCKCSCYHFIKFLASATAFHKAISVVNFFLEITGINSQRLLNPLYIVHEDDRNKFTKEIKG